VEEADVLDALGGGRASQARVLGEQPVTGVDGIRAGFLGDTDDFGNVQAGADRVASSPIR